ncbi:cell surface protein [Listeria monocytogenes]|nr:cell surface protein [Listeria monocytogenes]
MRSCCSCFHCICNCWIVNRTICRDIVQCNNPVNFIIKRWINSSRFCHRIIKFACVCLVTVRFFAYSIITHLRSVLYVGVEIPVFVWFGTVFNKYA